jgi:hypothetical protein
VALKKLLIYEKADVIFEPVSTHPMSDAAFQERLDAIVWGDSPDPYSHALEVVCCHWWNRPSLAVRVWAMAQAEEYGKKCVAISRKCDLNDPGVRVIYDHYFKIKDRYWNVCAAFGPLEDYSALA